MRLVCSRGLDRGLLLRWLLLVEGAVSNRTRALDSAFAWGHISEAEWFGRRWRDWLSGFGLVLPPPVEDEGRSYYASNTNWRLTVSRVPGGSTPMYRLEAVNEIDGRCFSSLVSWGSGIRSLRAHLRTAGFQVVGR